MGKSYGTVCELKWVSEICMFLAKVRVQSGKCNGYLKYACLRQLIVCLGNQNAATNTDCLFERGDH